MPTRLAAILRHPFLTASGIVLVGSMGANVLNYIFNLVAGRLLAPAVYGEAAALISLAMIVAVPSATLATLLTKYTAPHHARGSLPAAARAFRAAHRAAWLLGVSGTLLLALAAPVIARTLGIGLPSLLLFLTLFPLSMATAAVKGALQGAKQFTAYAGMVTLEALGKLLCGYALLLLGFGLMGVIAALIASALLSYAIGGARLRRMFSSSAPHVSALPLRAALARIPRYTWIVFAAALLTALITNGHVVLAKYFFPPDEAGRYAALAVLGRIVLYGGGAAGVALLPFAAASLRDRSRVLALGLGAVGTIAAVTIALFAAAPHLIVTLLFGGRYATLAPHLALMGAGQGFLALTTVLVQYGIAAHRTWFLAPFALCTLLQALLLALLPHTLNAATAIVASTNALLFFILLPFVISRASSSPLPADEILPTAG